MSVIKSKRKLSSVEFINTAMDLEIFTIKQCLKFPKRYTFVINNTLIDLAKECLINVKMANNIIPSNKQEYEARRLYLLTAKGNIINLYTQLDIARELFDIKENTFKGWIDLAIKEENLINGILKKDNERYKNLI